MHEQHTQKFFKATNAIFGSLQAMFSQNSQHIHRDIIARELTAQLGDHFPELIVMLNEGLQSETAQMQELIDLKFAQIVQFIDT